MTIQYQIMELDSEHLKKQGQYRDEMRERVCFLPAKLDSMFSNITGSLEEAVSLIEKYGNDYTEYTIIPRIYKTNY